MYKFTQNPDTNNHFKEHKLLTIKVLIIIKDQLNNKSSKLLVEKSDKITELSEENIRLSSDITKLNQEITSIVTGGNSFCYLFPTPSFGKINSLDFNLTHMGEYPVYDMTIKIWDVTCLNSMDPIQLYEKKFGYKQKIVTPEEWNKMKVDPDFIRKSNELDRDILNHMQECLMLNKNLGTITPIKKSNVIDPPLISFTVPKGVSSSNIHQEYDINIAARNGEYRQNIVVEIRNKRYYVHSKVEKIISESNSEVVREYESLDSEGFVIKNIK